MYGLLPGLQLANDRDVSRLVILGDSLITIQHLQKGFLLKNNNLSLLLRKINSTLKSFSQKAYYHILRSQNKEADTQTNQAFLLEGSGLV